MSSDPDDTPVPPEGLLGEQSLGPLHVRIVSILEAMSDAFVALDANGRFAYLNGRAERLLRRGRDDLLGRFVWDAFPEAEEATFGRAYRRAITEQVATSFEDVYEPLGGWFAVRIYPSPVGVAVLFADVTERRQVEAQRQHARKMEAIGHLAGGIAHDFNNLLTAILGYCELLLGDTPEDDPRRHDLREIHLAGTRAAGLIRQLLAFSRRQVLHPVPLNLNHVVRAVAGMMEQAAGEDLQITTALDRALWRTHADPEHVEQVLRNLLENARHAVGHGGRIEIETANVSLDPAYERANPGVTAGRYVRLRVRDTGHGMTEEIRQRVFDPFFTTRDPGQGTGLGLATVYGIVQQSGGHVKVESEVGGGSTFDVYLPAADDVTAQQPGEVGEAARGRLETVLVVEDDRQVQELTGQLLDRLGYRVISASDPRAALAIAADRDVALDLLVTDVMMPQLNGQQLADRVRAERPGLPVLFVSGYAEDVIASQGVLDPGVEFLSKPFTVGALAAAVRGILDTPPHG